jgi:hypothetical protein
MSKVLLVLAALMAMVALGANLCAHARRPTIVVMLRNDANVPPEVLDAAEDSVRAIYDAAGVEIAWSGGPPVATLALISREHARRLGHRPEVIGFATGSRARRGKMAYIFMHRVKDLSARYRVPASSVLGAVLAHELGHLLLPGDSHAEVGVMRPVLDQAEFTKANRGELLFTANQVAEIRSVLAPNASFQP